MLREPNYRAFKVFLIASLRRVLIIGIVVGSWQSSRTGRASNNDDTGVAAGLV